MADILDAYRSILGDCIDHQHEQAGRCVYCKTCGRRIYQGTLLTADEIAALKEAFALSDEHKADDDA